MTTPAPLPRWWRRARRAGIATGVVLAALAALFAAAVLRPEPVLAAERPASFAIRGVGVVDIERGTVLAGRTVVVEGRRIVAVGPDASTAVPPGATVVDGRDRYVMPALWDMHAHVYAVSPLLDLPLFVAYGVTNVRDMHGCPMPGDPFIACAVDKRRWTREAEAGLRVAPRIIETASFMANGPGMAARVGGPAFYDVATPAQARAFVRHFARRADAIKVYDAIPRGAYFALADEARRHGMTLVGHRPHAVPAVEAARYQRSLEHARFLLHESFDGTEALRAAAGTPGWHEDRRAMVDRHDPARADAILAAMREAGTFYVPTHLTRWADAYAEGPDVREDPALRYLHPLMERQWREDIDEVLADGPGPEARRAYRDFHRKGLELTRRAQAAGVRIMVGTDYIAPGLDVHRELGQLVAAGLTPREALAAATTTPALYAGRPDDHGAVAPGHVADLLLLDGNPLDDIRNTRRIRAVSFGGALYDAAALARIKAHVERNARSWTVGAKILWRFLRNPVAY